MPDLFALLRTAEAESRLCPTKASRLREVLMEGNGACQSSSCCWTNVVFRVMCELILGPAHPSTNPVMRPAVGVPEIERTFVASQPMMHTLSSLPTFQPSYSTREPLNETMQGTSVESEVDLGASAMNAQTLTVQPMQTSNEITCQPCPPTDTKPAAAQESSLENDEAVTTLVNMKMAKDSPTSNSI